MWLFAFRVGTDQTASIAKGIDLARAIHPRFVAPDMGVVWKMLEDLSGPYPGFGLGAIDAFHGLVVYNALAPEGLRTEIVEMRELVERSYGKLHVTQDLGLGMLLWMSHFSPHELWAKSVRERSLATLDRMWIDPPGYFCREPGLPI
jgi:hypothetical protein